MQLMPYFHCLERVAEELMGRRKWKLYQDALLPKRSEGEASSDEESMPATDPPPALKIKTIEQINAPEDERNTEEEPRRETILESLIKRPAAQPKVEEPVDWKPADKCYFCVDGERGEGAEGRAAGGATSPVSESDSSSVSGAKSPGAPPILQHLLQLQLQAQTPQAIAQFQQMIAALATIGTGLVQPALSQAWLMQRMVHGRQLDRLPDVTDKVTPLNSSPPLAEQPLDLSAKSTSSTSGTPPPDNKLALDNSRLSRYAVESACAANSISRRTYTEEELRLALRDIQSGRLGTRRAAVVYGIPRSTLRNKIVKSGLAAEPPDSEPDSDPERSDTPPSVILKIPTFPPPDEKSSSPATSMGASIAPITPILPPQPPSQLLLPPSVFADPPTSQHLFTSLSDVIAKSISQKFQQPLDRHHHPDSPYLRATERHVSVIKTPPDGQRGFASASNSRAAVNNNGQPATGKGTRPKRGKYRNYDRDSLVEAVKAVQRGEMSVHRAGSYYGVPHSTLEYKVKERHLMRPRKREPKPQPDVKPPPPKPPAPKPPGKPFANGLNGPEPPGYPPGYPFWPAAAFPPPPGPDLYASHMMRQLRDEARPPANGSFLEGIIRSSLERPGAALLQRLTAESPARPSGHAAPHALTAGGARCESPPARRARLDGSDGQLAAEMREAVQRLRADKLRPPAPPAPARNGTPPPPALPAPEPPDRG